MPGKCETSVRAFDTWEIRGIAKGDLICYHDLVTGAAELWWTYDGTGLILHASNSRGSSDELYRFFSDSKGFIVP